MIQVIVKFIESIKELENIFPDTTVVELFNNYAVVFTSREVAEALRELPQIIYVENSKQVYYNLQDSRGETCVSGTIGDTNLTGEGVLVGIADSGIDFYHEGFIDDNGESRIAFLWDQTGDGEYGKVPERYDFGREYNREELTTAINSKKNGKVLFQTESIGGHGTSVAGVAAGNGNGSPGKKYRGIAVKSDLIVVKLAGSNEFSGTTDVMLGVDYCVRKALEMKIPIAVNLSFGTNNGAHDGKSLFENYLSDLNGVWKNVIVAASGNEGEARHHASIKLSNDSVTVEFVIGPNEKKMSMEIWKQYVDDFNVSLKSPSGESHLLPNGSDESKVIKYKSTEVFAYGGAPTYYAITQEIYLEWSETAEGFIESGVWSLIFEPNIIKYGVVNMWLPTASAIGLSTGFLAPDSDTTLTIPSTSRNVITVGAYNGVNGIVASFSGRGNTTDNRQMPTLVAPGIGVVTTRVGGGYFAQTGTSIAAPFVTGGCALLMEWGIVRGNDVFLYGEKVKAYLMEGAKKMPGITVYPDKRVGFGALCVKNSLPKN